MSSRSSVVVIIKNRLGLHARPAMSFVDTASGFASSIVVRRVDQDETVDGKSIMDVMMLAATAGTGLEIVAEGDDSAAACEALRKLVEAGFDEP